ncbi:MAG: alpha/beta hydrolase [Gammaproteobacteria bacterium]|nr:alpha/beta hydrolase [Gammaproteobacteria bacterium]
MTSITKGYVDGPFGQIHYYATGDGPCLILAHQSPVCGRMFEKALPLLGARGIRAIAVDTPGFGNSDVPAEPPGIADYADAFVAVLVGLGLEQAHFLGHHTGAGILCNLAARYPDKVGKLVLNGPPLFSEEELAQYQEFHLGPLPIYEDGSHLQERWDQRVRFTPGWTDKVSMHDRLVDQMWAGDTWWYGHHAAFQYDMAPDFTALKGPVLIFTNTGDDLYETTQKARALRPDFAYAEVEGGTHDIVDEQPDAWAHIVADFILGEAV